MVNVMIVEDQKMIRSILERYINDEEGYETVASIAGARRAVELCDTAAVNLVLMDVQTELRENGLIAAKKIKAAHPEIKIMIVTSLADREVLEQAKAAGVDSLWYKDSDDVVFMDAVRRTVGGEHVFPDCPPPVEIGTAKSTDFTNAEMRVLRCLVQGMSYTAAAETLGVDPRTVKYHVSNMLQKTNFENKLQLAVAAIEARLTANFPEE